MASKKFSEFTLSNNSQSVELVGLQAGVNIRTGAVYPAYKDAQGNLVVNKITSTTDETGLLVTSNIKYNGDDNLYFENSQGEYTILHTGNTDLLPDPIVDHGQLTGLSDNDHPQYALLSGGTFTGAVRANLDPVNDRDLVPFKYMKDELAKGAFRGVQWKYGGNDAIAPASGYMKIVVIGGQNREILLNDTDANGYIRSCAAILAGDTLVISTSPTSFARYMVTAKATDMGTYWNIPAVRTDTQGSQTAPPIDTVLTVTATLSGTDVIEEYIPISQKGAPDGVAPLDSTGHISADYLNISGFHFIGGWDAAPGILPPDGADGDMYLITNEGTLTVVPPQSEDEIPVPTLCLEGQEIVYQVSKDIWYLMSANTALNDTRYVQLAGSTMTGHLTVPAGASGSQVRRASETDTLLAAKAPLASPAFTGLPTAPTAAIGTNTQQLATTAFVKVGTIPWTTGNVGDLLEYNGTSWVAAPPAMQHATFSYRFGSATTNTPNAGMIHFNNAGFNLTTLLYMNTVNDDGVDVAHIIEKLVVGDRIYIQLATDGDRWVKYDVSQLPVINGSVATIGVSYFDSLGATFTNNSSVKVILEQRGTSIVGGGGDVHGPDSSVQGYLPQWGDASGKLLAAGIPTSTFATSADLANKADKSYVDTQDGLKANIASPTFTGTPAAPTATAGTNTTQLATTQFVTSAISSNASDKVAGPTSSVDNYIPQWNGVTGKLLKGGIPTSTFATPAQVDLKADKTYVDGQDASKAPLASPALTGTPTAPTANQGVNTTQIATTAHVFAGLATKANLASPAFTGTPTAPTAGIGTNTTQIATTAFVIANQSASGGDVFGPANSTLDYIPQWADNTGKLLKAGIPTSNFATAGHTHSTYAPLASPAFTGTPTAPTAAAATNDTQLATTAYVTSGISTAVSGKADKSYVDSQDALKVDKASIVITDANSATLPGKYVLNSPYTNSPVADAPATIDVSVENGRITQVSSVWISGFSAIGTGYVRTFNGTSWSTWDFYTKSGQSPYFINVVNKVLNHGTIFGDLSIDPVGAGDQVVTLSGDVNVSFNTFWFADNQSVVVNLQFFNTGNHAINWPAGIWWSESKPVPTGTSQWTFNIRKNGSTVQINGYLVGDNMVAV